MPHRRRAPRGRARASRAELPADGCGALRASGARRRVATPVLPGVLKAVKPAVKPGAIAVSLIGVTRVGRAGAATLTRRAAR
eukprot:gene15352-23890_t